ncbi:MAG: YkgJ family cysteine cluster protein [Nitrospirae bacterium]|nr:YkgJ family cysteine cluster protein [Nitrospirota bacterium]
MDRAYEQVASHYGFSCKDCISNCCAQRFHHHTLTEYYGLLDAIKKEDPALREKILSRANAVLDSYHKDSDTGTTSNLMCPANFDGLCSLYESRPMICRLHGMPYVFRRPDGMLIEGGGCSRFQSQMKGLDVRIDRTPHYRALAELEKELRASLGIEDRYKKTTSEMLVDMVNQLEIGNKS